YVDKCRAGEAVALPSTPAASPTEPTATVPSAASPAPKKTVKACQDEWRANRPAYQAERITEKAYVHKCRTGEAVALPGTPAGAPTLAPAAPEALCRCFLLTHVGASFCGPVTPMTGKVVNLRSEIYPHNEIGRTFRFCLG